MKPNLLTLIAAVLALAPTTSAVAQTRETQNLASGWTFIRSDAGVQTPTAGWQPVTVPHTWNAADGANGKAADPQYPEGYYRGPAWYARALDVPAEWQGKRIFIRFEGVSLVADVFVNGIPVGRHRGAFAAFCFEITPYLRFDGKDTLKVRADNARTPDVAPLSGDFTLFGGIYRPVRLIATDKVCVSPLELASPGVFLTLNHLARDQAVVEVKSLISNGEKSPVTARLEVEVRDADDAVVAKASRSLDLPAADTRTVLQELSIPQPRLWNGRKDPYLYTTTVRVLRDGKVADEISQPLGIRTVAISPERGFLLNGEPYPLHGVNLHQDHAEKGWAIADADQDADHAMIVELGATTIRLAHYQQAGHIHDLSDRAGIIEWQEIPLVDAVGGSPAFLENARRQLQEMILQSWNHPAIAMWGLYNELDAKWAAVKTAPAVPVIQNLQTFASELDPSRPTVAAMWMQKPGELQRITDGMAWNIYPGWYGGVPADADQMIKDYSDGLVGKRIGISEYGAGANPAQFLEGPPKHPAPGGPFHPQEWQNEFHERLWSQLKDNPRLWGTWIWCMFDFASDKRNEGGTPGLNDKGLVTRDRKIRKDTFYFYKANWNPAPMVYIASRRTTPRTQATTEVKVYSNCAQVELKVNGQSLGRARPDGLKITRWPDVTLQPGRNTIEAVGTTAGQTITNTYEWVLEPATGSIPRLRVSPETRRPDMLAAREERPPL